MKTPRRTFTETLRIRQKAGQQIQTGEPILVVVRDPDEADDFGNPYIMEFGANGNLTFFGSTGLSPTIYMQEGSDPGEAIHASPQAFHVSAQSGSDEPEAFWVNLNEGSLPNPTIGIYKQGMLKISGVAPANGVINAGELFLYYDPTNGAAKLMLKGKTANGTVVTGQVALA